MLRSSLLRPKDLVIVKWSRSHQNAARPFDDLPSLTLGEIARFANPFSIKHMKHYFETFFDKYDLIFKLRYPGSKYYQVWTCNPLDGQELLRNDGPMPITTGFDFFVHYRNKIRDEKYISKGLVGAHGQKWHEVRTFVQQDMMRPRSAMFYIDTVDSSSRQLCDLFKYHRDEADVVQDVLPNVYRWALDSITSIFLNAKIGCLDQNPSADAISLVTQANVILGPDLFKLLTRPPVWKYFETPTFKRVDSASNDVYNLCRKYINEAADKIDMKNKETQTISDELSVLEKMFLRSGDDREIPTIMAMDAMMAGVDTTGAAATFLLYHLASNVEEQEVLYREICDHIGPRTSDPITEAKLKRMKYLRACAQESHRLRPVGAGVGRRTQVPMVLSNYRVPKGVSVQYLAFVSSSCPSQFDDPQVFRPERWLRGHARHHQAHAFSYIPFGHGSRMCIGRRFAELELSILVIRALQAFRLSYSGSEVGWVLAFTSKPDKMVNIKFSDR